MKLVKKAAAVFACAAVFVSALSAHVYADEWLSGGLNTPYSPGALYGGEPAYQAGSDPAGDPSGDPNAPASPTPSGETTLTSGAVCSGVTASYDKIKKDTKFTLYVTTIIPIANYYEGLRVADLPTDPICVSAQTNPSFQFLNPAAEHYSYWLAGPFLCVQTSFYDVTYLGTGNSFNYLISYMGENNSAISATLSGMIPGCVEYTEEKPDEPKTDTPSFVLQSAKTYTMQAGENKNLRFSFSSIGSGKFSKVGASLSSSDPSIKVGDMGEKLSASSIPSFDFPVSVSETASAGVYNLTLRMQVYDINGSPANSASYEIPLTVTSKVVNTGLSVDSYEVSKDNIKSGDKFKLTLKLKNNCGIDLNGVEVSLGIDDVTKFALDGGFSKKSVNIAKGKTSSVSFDIVAGDGIKSERETIGVKAEYRIDPSKAETVQSLDTSVIVTCKPKKTDETSNNKFALSMTDYTVDKVNVEDGTHFGVNITVTNSDKKDIKNARLSLMGLDGIKFAIDSGLTYADFDIGAGKSKSFSFELVGCSGISSIREVIAVSIDYGETHSDASVTVSCKPKKTDENKPGEDGVFAPNIIIESYDFGGTYVTAGQTFPLNVVIKNVSGSSVIENLKVTINGASNSTDGSIAYSPANSANSFFFETLGPKCSTTTSLDLLAKSDAAPNSYPVLITFEFEYAYNGKHYKGDPHSETITIPLQQEDRLQINEPEAPGYAVGVGDMCGINVSIVNKGKSSAYNVSATIEGEGFTTESPNYYIGNVDSGKEEYYDAQIVPQQEGEISGTIIFTYEDANGTAKEQRKEFKFTAMTMNFGGMYGDGIYFDDGMTMDVPQEQGGDMTWLWFVIGGAVLVIAGIIVTVVLVKKVKARKLQRELEEDDEDN